jgi:hypothetical protein
VAAVEAFLTSDWEAALEDAPGGGGGDEAQQAIRRALAVVRQQHAPPLLSGAQLLVQVERSRVLPIGCAGYEQRTAQPQPQPQPQPPALWLGRAADRSLPAMLSAHTGAPPCLTTTTTTTPCVQHRRPTQRRAAGGAGHRDLRGLG